MFSRDSPFCDAGGTISHEIDQKICISLYVHKHETRNRQMERSHIRTEGKIIKDMPDMFK